MDKIAAIVGGQMKKTACRAIIAACLLLMTLTIPAFAATSGSSSLEKAIDLKILGLFNGTDNGFDLERAPTRIEGAAMLLRLLGKEQEAINLNFSHPFTDVPSWANSLIGYMYRYGLTTGTGAATFGSTEQLTARQYVTFVLRALGYDDKNNDFKYENALDKAIQAGLLSTSEANLLKTGSTILRDDLAGISYNALKTKLKASSSTLLDKLAVQDKAVSKVTAAALGLYTSDLQDEYGNVASYKPVFTAKGYAAKNSTDFFNILKSSFYLNQTQIRINIGSYGDALKDFRAVFDRACAAVSKVTGVEDFISSWKYASDGTTLTLTVNYRYSKFEFQTLQQQAADTLNIARSIVAEYIDKGMSDYDKELFIHDYIINYAKYDYANYRAGKIPDVSFTAYGCLVLGKAVCQGYSEAFKLMCDLSGLECIVASGESQASGRWEGHSWNIVKVDGKYYHVDPTFDDPVSDSGKDILTYYYFNLSDSELSKKHRWNVSDYPVCSSMESNYYYKNGLVVSGIAEFEDAIMDALAQRETKIELKVKDYTEKVYANPSDIVFKYDDVTGFKYSSDNHFGIVSITDIKYR